MNSLLATFVICIGMSNGMPVSNYSKKQITHVNQMEIQPKRAGTITQDYELSIAETNAVNANSTQPFTYTDYLGTITYQNYLNYKSAQYRGGNSYINVIGNYYLQQSFFNNAVNAGFMANNNYYQNNGNYRNIMSDNYIQGHQRNTSILYVFKITPYNYNVNTTIELKIVNGFRATMAEQEGSTFNIYNVLYSSTDNTWDTFTDRNNALDNPYNIITEIEDINNGYYYNRTENLIENIGATIETTYTLNITPNLDNYFVISQEYLINNTNQDRNAETLIMVNTPYNYAITTNNYPIVIEGTNIIPGGSGYEVLDLPGLMFEVLGMPFAFASQAFNVTLFPGTPYQLNIANLFLGIIAMLVFIFIIKLIINASSKG